jgi:phosphatidylglycerol---prolipoprotein diacylglyceryl transferase
VFFIAKTNNFRITITYIMYPHIFHIYGPFYLNSYGLVIWLGLLISLHLACRDQRSKPFLSHLSSLLLTGIGAAVIGGRLLFCITNSWNDWYELWQGGFCILGSVLGGLAAFCLYSWWHRLQLLPFLDLVATYATLLQSISRIGCFLAGCCHGISTNAWWAITYTNPACCAPLSIPLHPTQLYSALFLLCIFFVLRLVLSRYNLQPGTIATVYLAGAALERGIIDFWRAERGLLYGGLSLQQWVGVFMLGALVLGYCSRTRFINRRHVPS